MAHFMVAHQYMDGDMILLLWPSTIHERDTYLGPGVCTDSLRLYTVHALAGRFALNLLPSLIRTEIKTCKPRTYSSGLYILC